MPESSTLKLPSVTWEFTDRQSDFWEQFEAGKRVGAFIGGIRAGKTWIGVRRLLKELVTRGGLGWVVTPTYTMMGAARRTFEEALPKGVLLGSRETPFPLYTLRGPKGKLEVEFRSAEEPDKLRGPALSVILLDEAAQLSDEVLIESGVPKRRCPAWEILLGRALDTRGAIIVTTTPKGRNWLYDEFVTNPGSEMFIVKARTDENPTLLPEGIEELRRRYSGLTARQELEAEFVTGEGIFFAEWDPALHICEPFEVPPTWRWHGALDDGYVAPCSFGLYVADPEGTLYRTAELYQTTLVTAEKAKKIAGLIGSKKLQFIVADPSIWAKKSDTGESTADVLARELRKALPKTAPGLIRGSNDRVNGWKRCREWLNPVEGADGVMRARFKIWSTCGHFIRTVPAMVTDQHNVEDADTHGEDHVADEWRYLCMSRPRPASPSMGTPEPYTGAWFIKQFQKKRLDRRYIRP